MFKLIDDRSLAPADRGKHALGLCRNLVDLCTPAQYDGDTKQFLDVNFDGCLDIRVIGSVNAYGEPSYTNRLWNESSRTWESSSGLDRIVNPKYYEEDKVITSYTSSLASTRFQVFSVDGNEVKPLVLLEYDANATADPVTWEERVYVYNSSGEEEEKTGRVLQGEEYHKLDRESMYEYCKNMY